MDTKKIMRAFGGGFAGFLVLLFAHWVLLIPLLFSISSFGGKSYISPLILLLFFVATLTLAFALPMMALSVSKKVSLFVGFAGCILAMVIIPLQYDFGLFNLAGTLASIIPVGITMIAISYYPSENRQRRVGVLLGVWVAFLILGAVVASFSQIGGALTILLVWLVLPAVTAALQ